MRGSIDEQCLELFGSEFKDLSNGAQNELLGSWAKNGRWDDVLERLDFINPFRAISDFNEIDWHSWLLTRDEDQAFEVWKALRITKSINAQTWNDAAARLIYANKPERLKDLVIEDWSAPMKPDRLRMADIAFEPANNECVFSINKLKAAVYSTNYLMTPWQAAAYHGSPQLLGIVLEKLKEWSTLNVKVSQGIDGAEFSWRRENLVRAFSLLLNQPKTMSAWMPVMNGVSATTNQSIHGFNDIIQDRAYDIASAPKTAIELAIIKLDGEDSKIFLNEISDRDLKIIQQTTTPFEFINRIKRYIMNGEVERANIWIEFCKKWNCDFKIVFSKKELWTEIEAGSKEAVENIVKYDASLVRAKDWIYVKGASKKQGDALACAVFNNKQEIAISLLNYGFNVQSLRELLAYKPLEENIAMASFKTLAENFLLKSDFKSQVQTLSNMKVLAL